MEELKQEIEAGAGELRMDQKEKPGQRKEITQKRKSGRMALFMKEETYRQMAGMLSFILPVTIVLCIFILKGIYPFGDRSFLFSDMYHQYMPFFTEFMEKIKAGEGLHYSYHVGIGSNFLALYVYYLASPLHWLAFLFPQAHLMEFMSYLVVIKLGLCGASSFYYLHKHFGEKDPAILFFSTFYALSGFVAAYNWNIMWIDCVVLLPLILLGLERLVKEEKCTLYCVALALSIFTNFYISIMICMFVVLYFVLLLITERCNIRIIGKFALYSLLAGGMAGILLVPEVCAILATDFGDISFPEVLQSYFPVLDMLARHCMCVTTERGLEHWPNIYCGVAVFLLLPMYALDEKIPVRKRFCKLALMGFLLLGFSTNMLDFIWHGLNYPDSLPARQSFVYILLVLTMCYEAYRSTNNRTRTMVAEGVSAEEMKEYSGRRILYPYLGAVVFLLFCEKFIDSEDFDTGVKFLSLLFVTFYAVLMYWYQVKNRKLVRVVIGLFAFVLITAESSINLYNTSIGTVSRSAYLEQQPNYQALYEYAKEQEDGEFFRMEKFERKTKNDATLAGYPSASVFSSTMNSTVMDLYKRFGMRHSKVYYGFDGATMFTSALLNVDWMFWEGSREEKKDFENPFYTYVKSEGNVDLYACEVRLPFGYVAPLDFEIPKNGNGIYLQNLLVKKLGIQEELFASVAAKQDGEKVRVTADEDGIYYAQITSGGNNKIRVDGAEYGEIIYSDIKDGSVLYLGYLEAGQVVMLENANEEDTSPKITAKAYKMEEAVLEQAIGILSENYLGDVTFDTTHINGHLALENPGRLILSVPFEKGWTIWVNGEEVEPGTWGDSFMALELDAGEYEIAMEYVPEGKWAGIWISVVSLFAFGGILASQKLKKTKLSKNTFGQLDK